MEEIKLFEDMVNITNLEDLDQDEILEELKRKLNYKNVKFDYTRQNYSWEKYEHYDEISKNNIDVSLNDKPYILELNLIRTLENNSFDYNIEKIQLKEVPKISIIFTKIEGNKKFEFLENGKVLLNGKEYNSITDIIETEIDRIDNNYVDYFKKINLYTFFTV